MQYWYRDERILAGKNPVLPIMPVRAIGEIGTFQRLLEDVRVIACVRKLASLDEALKADGLDDTKKALLESVLAKLTEGMRTVNFVVHFASGEAEADFVDMWAFGEDAKQRAKEHSNDYIFMRIEKVEYLQTILQKNGEKHGGQDIVDKFKSWVQQGKITFADKSQEIKNKNTVNSMLLVARRLKSAGVSTRTEHWELASL